MKKLLLMSLMLALIAVPLLAARDQSAIRAFKRMLVIWLGYALFYVLAMRYIYPHLS